MSALNPRYGREGRPKRRKRTKTSVKASCDSLWSKVVKKRAWEKCERCGTSPDNPQAYHAHHVYGRNNHRLRFEPRNGMALCATCHRWAEDHPLEYAEWFRRQRGPDYYWLMKENRKGTLQRSLTDYLELESELSDMLAP